MVDLRARLVALLDVIQQAHTVNRATAARIVAAEMCRSHTVVLRIAQGTYRHAPEYAEELGGRLARLEAKYAKPLRYRVAYLGACKKVAA